MGQSDRRKRSPVRCRVLITCALLMTPFVFVMKTASATSRQTKERTARKACLSGDYTKGVSILSDLFVDTKDPNYIFNQARCFEQNRRYEDAVARFQEYLRAAPDLDASDKAAAERHIAGCQDLLAKQLGFSRVVAAPAGPTEQSVAKQAEPLPPPTSPPANTAPPPIVHAKPLPPSSVGTGAGLRVGGIVMASLGCAALLGGIIFNLKANAVAHDLGTYGGYSDSKASQRKDYETAGWVGYGLGAAGVAVGSVLYYLGLQAERHSSSVVAIVPLLKPDILGATLGGSF
jgi:hypothetical protein